MRAVDYSFSRPNLDCLKSKGCELVIRYGSIGPSGKNCSPAEAQSILNAGLDLVMVFEESTGHMLGGAEAGKTAAFAARDFGNRLGMPPGAVWYFALDIDPTTFTRSQWDSVGAYLDACCVVLGQEIVGVYGPYSAIEKLVPERALWGWQTYAWSHGQISSKAHLYQYLNHQIICDGIVDYDRILKRPYGGWKGDLMPTVDEIADAVAKRLGLRDTTRVADSKDVGVILHGDATHPKSVDSIYDNLLGLPDLVVEKIPVGGVLTPAQVKQAVKDALAEGVLPQPRQPL